MAKGQQHKLDDFGDKKVSYVPEKKKDKQPYGTPLHFKQITISIKRFQMINSDPRVANFL